MESVRSATPDDLGRLGVLADGFLRGVVAQRGGPLLVAMTETGAVPAGFLDGLMTMAEDGQALVLVGALEDVVVGFAACHLDDGTVRRGVLDVCFVEEEARGVGVGRLLLDTTLAWMSDQGCDGVDGTALPGDRQAKNFFEAAGFKARVLTMYRDLG